MKNSFNIYGIHAILVAVKSNVSIEKIWLQKGKKGSLFHSLEKLIRINNISCSYVPPEKLIKLKDKNHQGAIALISQIEYINIERLIENGFSQTSNPTFLLLDGITDSRNFGAIIRSCAATSVNGVIIPQSGSALINDLSVKTSSGGIFKVPISRVNHLKDAIFILKSFNTNIIAISEKSDNNLFESKLKKPTAFIMGSENRGINNGLMKLSDTSLKLPMFNSMDSLNVSVASGIILYEKIRQNLN